ncbi:MAG: alanine--tRNA ligase, partial [Pseudomonadota bacterium]
RGYVLRRIIRRAIRHGYKLGTRAAFFHRMVADLDAEMGEAYPELRQNQTRVTEVLMQEEERFFTTIEHGMAILEADLAEMAGQDNKTFNGETAFKLHDTYGFPLDLTQDVCREHNVAVDAAAFDAAMSRQKELARAAGKFKMAANLEYDGPATAFHGYDMLETKGNVLALYRDGSPVNELQEGETGVVVLDDTPFYAESGGQAGDRGLLQSTHGIFAVEDTQKIQATVFGHHGVVRTGKISVGNGVTAKVDALARARTVRNHSATHLMHKALREVLGEHVQQKGSQVDADKTRFDFVHSQPMTNEEIRRVENLVNAEILANSATECRVLPIAEAQKLGAMMLFGEKYGDEVRVLDIGTSRELCGGTHVQRTGDIGLFSILAEGGVAAGVRRVEAVTGDNALTYMQGMESALGGVAGTLKVLPKDVPARVVAVLDQVRKLERELAALKGKLASAQSDDLVSQAVDVQGVRVLAAKLESADVNAMRETMDKLKDKLGSAAIVLGSVVDGKVTLIAGVTADLIAKVKAGELVNFVAQQVGGKGGGRPDMAQAGGTQPENLDQALAGVAGWVKTKL